MFTLLLSDSDLLCTETKNGRFLSVEVIGQTIIKFVARL
ncbi:Hypothetical protein ADU72_0923 [Pediococcus damnosus]|uniref:Uncharacterized protein n=1 Tax=Pediococcus damnosus TaxID=51663 RepID=A0AAC9FJ82_9LACO|nr:Hypothetical protein ADU70_1770 [Pediococcus damnosus]AMV66864.1 Hypothetical protein ADU72_0923 [Pediococcus damnosus]